MTACRSSRFLPGDPDLIALGLGLHALQAEILDDLVDLLGVVGRDAGVESGCLAQRSPRGLFDLSVGDGLERHLPADELLLQDLDECTTAVLGRRVEEDLVPLQLDGRAGVLEVEAGGDLPARLVDRVAHFLQVDLGGDIEARHARTLATSVAPFQAFGAGSLRRPLSCPPTGRYPSGQREQTVNLPAQPSKVRILPGPPSPSTPASPPPSVVLRPSDRETEEDHPDDPETEQDQPGTEPRCRVSEGHDRRPCGTETDCTSPALLTGVSCVCPSWFSVACQPGMSATDLTIVAGAEEVTETVSVGGPG